MKNKPKEGDSPLIIKYFIKFRYHYRDQYIVLSAIVKSTAKERCKKCFIGCCYKN